MLMQNFKAATDLGITEIEIEALIKVLGMLERQEIPEELFDMETVGEPECGTAGCILGWTRTVNMSAYDLLDERWWDSPSNSALDALFSPIRHGPPAHDATPSQAAVALRSYLTTGDSNWAEALAENH